MRDEGQQLIWSLPGVPASVPVARHLLTTRLEAIGCEPAVVDDAGAVLTELLSNAVRHARPRPDGQVTVTVDVDDDAVRLAVSDGGASTIPSVVSPPPLAASGRGLGIVHSLTHDWGVQEGADGTTVFGILSRA